MADSQRPLARQPFVPSPAPTDMVVRLHAVRMACSWSRGTSYSPECCRVFFGHSEVLLRDIEIERCHGMFTGGYGLVA